MIQIFEPVLFTRLNIEAIGKQKPSEVHEAMRLVAKKWGLNIAFQSQYNVALRIVRNEVKNN